jgi:hypothetical protein
MGGEQSVRGQERQLFKVDGMLRDLITARRAKVAEFRAKSADKPSPLSSDVYLLMASSEFPSNRPPVLLFAEPVATEGLHALPHSGDAPVPGSRALVAWQPRHN